MYTSEPVSFIERQNEASGTHPGQNYQRVSSGIRLEDKFVTGGRESDLKNLVYS